MIHSIYIFNSFKRFVYLIDTADKLVLDDFPLINQYREICKKSKCITQKKQVLYIKIFT
jgi:hypothetical protein